MLFNLALLALPLSATAQIVAECNPLLSTGCPSNDALAGSFSEDFTEESQYFTAATFPDRITYSDEGVAITLAQRFDNPALKSNFYIMFGRMQIIAKAAPGRGVVSSFYLQSDDLDEIDIEWIGSDITEVQTNFFSKGNVETYDRGAFHGVNAPQEEYHNYTIDWTEDALTWYLDGAVLRTLPSNSPSGYPQSPMYVVAGVWAGGDPSNQPGTIEWAGGLTDYSQAPFTMHIKNIVVADYSTGSEYVYSDQTGSWQSIDAVDGEVLGRVNQAQQDFAVLTSGGDIDELEFEDKSYDDSSLSSRSTGSSSSSASPSSSSSKPSSSKDSSSSSSEKESEKSSETSTSEKPSSSVVYSSSASSLISRSESSAGKGQSTTEGSGESSALETTEHPSTTLETTVTSSNSDSGSSTTSAAVYQANSATSPNISLGFNGLKALFVSITITVGLLFAV